MLAEQIESPRRVDPKDVLLPPGYQIEAVLTGLNTPISHFFTAEGELFIADAGVTDGNGKVLQSTKDGLRIIAEGFNPPLTGITSCGDRIYVSHRGFITVIDRLGRKKDILAGLPSWGDHHNNKVEFGPDGKMYFGQGTATNSGVVGLDNIEWVKEHPFFHDYPGEDIVLRGNNYITDNPLTANPADQAETGGYEPFAVPGRPREVKKGITRASGSVLRADPDGANLELVAWGLRNPFRMRFDKQGILWLANHGMDVRGSRPVNNSPDEFQRVFPGAWYGWPDFTGGLPVTDRIFKPANEPQPTFLLARHPLHRMPKPFALFEPHSATMGFDFNYDSDFGYVGDAFLAEYGSEAPETTGGAPLPNVGHRVVRIEMQTGLVYDFAVNISGLPASLTGGGGLERPIDVSFGPDHAMYVLDWGIARPEVTPEFVPNTGVLWRITRH